MLKLLINYFLSIKWGYLIKGAIVIVEKGGKLNIEKRCSIFGSIICVHSTCNASIAEGTIIKNSRLFIINKNSSLLIGKRNTITNSYIVVDGKLHIGNENLLNKGYSYRNFCIQANGEIFIGNRNRLRGRIWLRFGGILKIGDYNNINEDSEIRCDKAVTIGNYNQISYECMIWDTNTHCIYPAEKRRELAQKKYPVFGFEYESPKTKPILIGDDCWIGKRVTLLKGSTIGSRCIIGYGTTISNQTISDNMTVIEQKELIFYNNNI